MSSLPTKAMGSGVNNESRVQALGDRGVYWILRAMKSVIACKATYTNIKRSEMWNEASEGL